VIVLDQAGNQISEGDVVVYEGKFGPVHVKKITPIMEPGPMHGGVIVEGMQMVRWHIPPGAPPIIPAFKPLKPDQKTLTEE
jgi:hypothetical protein